MKVGDTVYLTRQFGSARVGDAGTVIGFYRRAVDEALAVKFSYGTYSVPERFLTGSDVERACGRLRAEHGRGVAPRS